MVRYDSAALWIFIVVIFVKNACDLIFVNRNKGPRVADRVSSVQTPTSIAPLLDQLGTRIRVPPVPALAAERAGADRPEARAAAYAARTCNARRSVLPNTSTTAWAKVQREGRRLACGISGHFYSPDQEQKALLRSIMGFVRDGTPFAWVRWGDGDLNAADAWIGACWPGVENLFVAVGTFFMCDNFRRNWERFYQERGYVYLETFYLQMGDPGDIFAEAQAAEGVPGWIVAARRANRSIALVGPRFMQGLPFITHFCDERNPIGNIFACLDELPKASLVAMSKGTAAKHIATLAFRANARMHSYIDVGRALNPYAGRAEFGHSVAWYCARADDTWMKAGVCTRSAAARPSPRGAPPNASSESAVPQNLLINYFTTDFAKMNPAIAHNIQRTVRIHSAHRLIFDDDAACLRKLKQLPFATDALVEWFDTGNKFGKYRSDLCRLVQLYTHGGLYVDNDIQPVLPLKVPADCRFATVFEDVHAHSIVQSIIGAAPRDPTVRTSIEYIEQFAAGKRRVEGFLGPITMRDAMREHPYVATCMWHEIAKAPETQGRRGAHHCNRAVMNPDASMAAYSRAIAYGDNNDHEKVSCYENSEQALRAFVREWQGSPRVGVLVHECSHFCGGTGDRLKGLTSLFLDAIRLKADFKVHWTQGDVTKWLPIVPEMRFDDAKTSDVIMTAIDRGYRYQDLVAHLAQGRTVRVRTNRQSSDAPILLPFPLWTFIGPVFRKVFRVSAELEEHAQEAFPAGCDVCVHARIGDAASHAVSFPQRFHDKVVCAKKLAAADSCVFLASDNDGFKRAYADDPRVLTSSGAFAHVDHSSASALHGLAELIRLSRCKALVFGGSGFSLAAHAIGSGAAFDHKCERKTGQPVSHVGAPFAVL